MKSLVKGSVVLVIFLLLGGVAIAQQNEFGGEGKTPTAQQTTRSIRLLEALPDGNQPVIVERKSGPQPKGAVSDELLEQISKESVTYTPLWEGLDQLSFSDKQNALIQLEVPHDLQTVLLKQVQEIEQLWNSGEFDQAVALLRGLEELQSLPSIAVGISWKVPIATSESKWGTDVQIEGQTVIYKPCLDFHNATGNLFAVLRRQTSDDVLWTMNISTDGGQTWQETYTWSGANIIDVSAAVVDAFLYVTYVAVDGSGGADWARIRRFNASTGEVDNVYYYKVVFDVDINIQEVALCTDADQSDDRIYYFAILADNSLVFYWADAQGETWYQIATGISNADHGLDACWNQDYTEWAIWVSFVAIDDGLHVARYSGLWEDIWADTDLRDVTSVGAYQNRILVAYEYTDFDIKYMVSYDEGENWYNGFIAYSADEPPFFHEPHVTGRKGGGFAVVYEQEWNAEPDTCWFKHRDYDTPLWSVPQPINEVDVTTGRPMTVERIPPLDPACHAYGSIWVSGNPYNAYFDRIDRLSGDANGDGIVNVNDAIFVLNYLFREGSVPVPLWTGDANCDDIVDVNDAIHVLNYLFRGGDPPCC